MIILVLIVEVFLGFMLAILVVSNDVDAEDIENLLDINEEHQKINGELRKENKHLNDLLNQALKDYDELLKKGDNNE